jgi:hypothetical protein
MNAGRYEMEPITRVGIFTKKPQREHMMGMGSNMRYTESGPAPKYMNMDGYRSNNFGGYRTSYYRGSGSGGYRGRGSGGISGGYRRTY